MYIQFFYPFFIVTDQIDIIREFISIISFVIDDYNLN